MKLKRRDFLKGIGLSLLGLATGIKAVADPPLTEVEPTQDVESLEAVNLFAEDSMSGGFSGPYPWPPTPLLVERQVFTPEQRAAVIERLKDPALRDLVVSSMQPMVYDLTRQQYDALVRGRAWRPSNG